jgi:Fe-S-cluster containining protein
VSDGDRQLVSAWLDAARDEPIASALESIYDTVRTEIEARAPVCWASGRCCNFEQTGHRLYVTGLEAAYTMTRLNEKQAITRDDVDEARSRGGCPFQELNLCSVHTIKPLGCRTYFCDRTATEWQQTLTERSLDGIKSIHERFGVPYRYAEWRAMLELFTDAWPRAEA